MAFFPGCLCAAFSCLSRDFCTSCRALCCLKTGGFAAGLMRFLGSRAEGCLDLLSSPAVLSCGECAGSFARLLATAGFFGMDLALGWRLFGLASLSPVISTSSDFDLSYVLFLPLAAILGWPFQPAGRSWRVLSTGPSMAGFLRIAAGYLASPAFLCGEKSAGILGLFAGGD